MICQQCAKRDGTEIWTGSGVDVGLAYAHRYQCWCRECALTAQIAHCRACAEQIPALEAALAALIAEERHAARDGGDQ